METTRPKTLAALYRAKAEEARTIAEAMTLTNARVTVLELAATWDQLADDGEKTLPRSK